MYTVFLAVGGGGGHAGQVLYRSLRTDRPPLWHAQGKNATCDVVRCGAARCSVAQRGAAWCSVLLVAVKGSSLCIASRCARRCERLPFVLSLQCMASRWLPFQSSAVCAVGLVPFVLSFPWLPLLCMASRSVLLVAVKGCHVCFCAGVVQCGAVLCSVL